MSARLALAVLCLSGCASLPQSTSLERAAPSPIRSARTVWLDTATISDPLLADPAGNGARALTLSLKRYLEQTGGFASVRALPGELASGDQVLAFHFAQLHVERRPHPAYFSAAILTLTLYIWFGGPVYVDTTRVDGELIVRDSARAELERFPGSASSQRNVSFSEGPWAAGAADRTRAVKEMVDGYLRSLATQHSEVHR